MWAGYLMGNSASERHRFAGVKDAGLGLIDRLRERILAGQFLSKHQARENDHRGEHSGQG